MKSEASDVGRHLVTYLVLVTDVVPEHGGVPEETESGSASDCCPVTC